MTMTNQNFTVYQGMDREVAFTLTGVNAAPDISAATWKGGDISKTLGDELEAVEEDGAVKIVLTLVPADTAEMEARDYHHQLTATDSTSKRDMTATGIMTVKTTL